MNEKLGIKRLSNETGFSKRQIRMYVAKRMIKHPTGKGPGSFYDQEDLNTLREIKRLRDDGLTLSKIKERLKRHYGEEWHRYPVRQGLELHVKSELEEQSNLNIRGIIQILSLMLPDD